MKSKLNRLTNEEKNKIKNELIYFFESERDEKIGLVAAEELLNFFMENAGGMLYNRGIKDAKKTIEHRLEELNYDLDELFDY